MRTQILALATSLLVGTVILLSCSRSATTTTDTSYQGPGSVWSATLKSDNSFTITKKESLDSEVELTVNGTYTTLDSGFLKLTVTDASGTDAPTAGSQAYALNVPGMVLLVKPIGDSNGEIIPMVASGSCPTSTLTANWVQVNKSDDADFSDADHDYFGTFSFDPETLLADLPHKFSLTNKDLSGSGGGIDNSDGNSCSGGILEVGSGGNGGILWLTESGAAIVTTLDNGESNGSIIAMPAETITQANLDGTYAGLVFTDDNGTFPVQIVFSSNGTAAVGKEFDDIETNSVSSTDSATFAFATANQIVTTNNGTVSTPGFMTGTINSTSKVSCMALENANSSGKNIVFCIGQSPGDTTEMFSVMAVQVN